MIGRPVTAWEGLTPPYSTIVADPPCAHVRTWHAVRSGDPIVRRRHALDALDRIHRKASR